MEGVKFTKEQSQYVLNVFFNPSLSISVNDSEIIVEIRNALKEWAKTTGNSSHEEIEPNGR